MKPVARSLSSHSRSNRSGGDLPIGSGKQIEDRMRVLLFACTADDAQRALKYGERMETAYMPSYDMEEIRHEIERFKPKLVTCGADAFLRSIYPRTSGFSKQGAAVTLLQSQSSLVTPREKKVLAMVAKGQTNDEIASGLRVSSRTVKRILSGLFERLNATNRTELTSRASRLSLIESDDSNDRR